MAARVLADSGSPARSVEVAHRARTSATCGWTTASPERTRLNTASSTPRRSRASTSLTMNVCESRGQLRTT